MNLDGLPLTVSWTYQIQISFFFSHMSTTYLRMNGRWMTTKRCTYTTSLALPPHYTTFYYTTPPCNAETTLHTAHLYLIPPPSTTPFFPVLFFRFQKNTTTTSKLRASRRENERIGRGRRWEKDWMGGNHV